MRKILLLLLVFGLWSCTSDPYEYVELTHPNGTPQVVKYYKTEDKKVLLRKIEYHENGQKRIEGTFKNGVRDGEWNAWFADGKLWSRGHFKDGKENGLKTVWHPNGQKYYEGEVKNNERTGIWKFWDLDGNLQKEVDYDNP